MSILDIGNKIDYNIYHCVRTDYYYANCSACVDSCPEGAFLFKNQKVLFKNDLCTSCGGCIGGCPSEAIKMPSFDPNEYILNFIGKEEKTLSSAKGLPALTVFDSHHFITAVLRKKCDITLEITPNEKIDYEANDSYHKNLLIQRVEQSNAFLTSLNVEFRVLIDEKKEETIQDSSRRTLFKSFGKKVAEKALDVTAAHSEVKGIIPSQTIIPLKIALLKNSLKEFLDENESYSEQISGHGLIINKNVDSSLCTNCGDCFSFCPTKAFNFSSDKEQLYFQSGKCIGCEICNEICPEKCITNEDSIDIVSYAFDRADKKVDHEVKVCRQCKLGFFARTAEKVSCHHCQNLNDNFADLFVPEYMRKG